MARVIPPPPGGPQNDFERRVLDVLRRNLSDDFVLLPNFQLKEPRGQSYEYDVVILAPHVLFVLEAKEWYGHLTGDDHEWLLNHKARRCPLPLVNLKCKILKSALGAIGSQLWVEPLLVVPVSAKTRVEVQGNWGERVTTLDRLSDFVRDPMRVKNAGDVGRYREAIEEALYGNWLPRLRAERRRIGSYEIVEALADDGETAEYLGRQALFDDPVQYRIRVWRLDPTRPKEEVDEQKAVFRRPAEALARIAPHPNLLPIRQFEFDDEHNEYYEVTAWSDFGTLHGYLENTARDELTLKDRLEIAAGVAEALKAIHEMDLVHRNLCPQTILIDFQRRPQLTDFDRAYIAKQRTVFPATEKRLKNPAYLPPELAYTTDYDFNTGSDMYAFGVLLYRLLTDREPFTGPAEAKSRRGKADPPSTYRDELGQEVDELIGRLLRVENFNERPPAAEALQVLRTSIDGSRATTRVTTTTASSEQTTWQPGHVVEGKYRIDKKVGEGGFSQVYRVYHFDQQRTLAMKVLRPGEDSESVYQEFKHSSELPVHPNIAKTIWMDRFAGPGGQLYLLSEFVEGEPLTPFCDGTKRLSLRDVRTIAIKLLNALETFHPMTERIEELQGKTLTAEEYDELLELKAENEKRILHRDVKPANILLEEHTHEPKIIDFNIASQLAAAVGRGGTPRYWAPDRGLPEWRPDMDLFSLGLVIYEMVTHRHPYPDDNPEKGEPQDPCKLCQDPLVSDELAAFLLKAVQRAGADRFRSAREMRGALEAVGNLHAPAPKEPTAPGTFPGIQLAPEERGKANYNPYVTRLQTLYSQARRTNAGTRGLDDIAELTYVETRLDKKLAPAIADGKFRLMIITGNAGDGKTAFLQKVETLFRKNGAKIKELDSGNGSRWSYQGLTYETNYDGSQDEGDRDNDVVLEEFFEPFAGSRLGGLSGEEVRLIAINEGRLLDFLLHGKAQERFVGLREFVVASRDGRDDLPEQALLINLNLRAVVADGKRSMVSQQLDRILRDDLWAPCWVCELADRCPLKHNADTLRDSASGKAVRERIHRLFEVLHLRRRAHVTMRDLRSALSWMLLRDHGCDDVARLLASDEPGVGARLASLSYTQAFQDAPSGDAERVPDRLVRLLREVDVGRVDLPPLDRRLDYDPWKAVPWMTFDEREAWPDEVLRKLVRDVPKSADEMGFVRLLVERRQHLAYWRRRAYFERRDDGWAEMLPFRALDDLESVILREDLEKRGELRDTVIRAISISEGLRDEALIRSHVTLRVSRVKEPSVRSYRLFPKEDFALEVASSGKLGLYLETVPDVIELVYQPQDGHARLRMSLDLLEMLKHIEKGYRPSPADLQGLFVNLLIFRNELLNLPFSKILVTPDDQDFYEISASHSGGHIRLHLEKQEKVVEGDSL